MAENEKLTGKSSTGIPDSLGKVALADACQKHEPLNLGPWPLQVSANKRFLRTPEGSPFLINGDTVWSLITNSTYQQITDYMEQRAAQGFNAVVFEAPNAHFTTQTPLYRDVDGNDPFTSTSYTSCSWVMNDAYWDRVDHAVNEALRCGLLCLITPAYLGFGGGAGNSGDQGWTFQINAASDATLRAYGQALANRFRQGNILWVMGGDYNPPNPEKGWNIGLGIQDVAPQSLFTFHGARGSSGYSQANGLQGFNVNVTYTDGTEYTYCGTEYGRAGPFPFFHFEGWYEGDGGLTEQGYRRQAYVTMLSGGCGHVLGVSNLWGVGAYGSTSAAQAYADFMDTVVALDMQHFKAVFEAYAWEKLEPKTDTSLITTSLGSGGSRIVGARASDGTFAIIWTPSQNFTVNMAALSPSTVRARWFNTQDGTYTAAGTFSNTGTQAFTAPGERLLVLDQG